MLAAGGGRRTRTVIVRFLDGGFQLGVSHQAKIIAEGTWVVLGVPVRRGRKENESTAGNPPS